MREREYVEAILAPKLKSQGYEVFVEPSPIHTPYFFEGFRPDLIALKSGENLIYEVFSSNKVVNRQKLEKLRKITDGISDWSFKAITLPSDPVESKPGEQGAKRLEAHWDSLRLQCIQANEHSLDAASFLTAWTYFESVFRHILPTEVESMSPGAIESYIFENLDIVPEKANWGQLSMLRNQLIHGVPVAVPVDATDTLISVTDRLRKLETPEITVRH